MYELNIERRRADERRMTRRALRPVLAVLAVGAAALGTAAPANAGLLAASADDCADVTTARVFAPWLDPAQYFIAPDGGFEAGAEGWELDGASVVDGNEPFEVSGPGSHSLALPSGAAATSPVVCVGIDRPTIRFFAKRTSGSLLSSLRVDVNFVGPLGLPLTLPVGTVGSGSWQPSPAMVVAASLLPLLPGERTPVTFTFTPQGGSWLVDDVHVDPYGKR
jgi:hypothetical protein